MKKLRSLIILALCSGLLLTSCTDSNKEKEIEDKLEEAYGGDFTFIRKMPIYDFPFIPSYYQYFYEWDQLDGKHFESVYVSTKGDGFQTNTNYAYYYDDIYSFFTAEIGKAFPGQILSSHVMEHFGGFETEIEKISYDEALHDQEYNLDCIIGVDDVSDHETVERILDETFKGYKMRVQAEIVSKEDAELAKTKADSSLTGSLEIFYDYKEHLPDHEYYLYISDTETMKGATGWYDKKASAKASKS